MLESVKAIKGNQYSDAESDFFIKYLCADVDDTAYVSVRAVSLRLKDIKYAFIAKLCWLRDLIPNLSLYITV